MSDNLNIDPEPGVGADPGADKEAGPESGPKPGPEIGRIPLPGSGSNNRRKTLIALVMAFLVLGGGIFTFFIFQGLGDFKGEKNGSFTYGFAARNIILPLSNYFSLGDNDLGVARRTGEKLTVKGGEPSLLDGATADVSDWMAKPDPGSRSGSSASASYQPSARTAVPKMGGGLGSAVGGGSSGGSKSSGGPSSSGASKFSPGSDTGNTKITAAQGGRGGPQGRSGTLNALGTARASLSEGLKSGSAMAAKSKWDQGFGLGTTGKRSGDMAYGKSGMVALDNIKKGDIADLKTTDMKSLKTNEPGAPERDTASEAKDANLAKMKGDMGADVAKSALGAAASEVGKSQDKAGPDARTPKVEVPPPDVIKLATTPPPKGTFCPDGCGKGGDAYKDANVSYGKCSDGAWCAVYEGKQGDVAYKDVMKIDPTKPEGSQVTPVGSLVDPNAQGLFVKAAEFGGTEPEAAAAQ